MKDNDIRILQEGGPISEKDPTPDEIQRKGWTMDNVDKALVWKLRLRFGGQCK